MDGAAARHHVLLICPERPGYGKSDPAPVGYSVAGSAGDLETLPELLEERLQVAGRAGERVADTRGVRLAVSRSLRAYEQDMVTRGSAVHPPVAQAALSVAVTDHQRTPVRVSVAGITESATIRETRDPVAHFHVTITEYRCAQICPAMYIGT